MMIRFFGDEITLKTTLLVCITKVIFNALVLCVTSLEKQLQPSMISTYTIVFFFTKANLCCHTNSFSMKHVMDQNQEMFGFPLPQAIALDNVSKNMALNLKIIWDHFHHMTHQGPTLRSLLKLDIFVS
jgi:hypothetical protein